VLRGGRCERKFREGARRLLLLRGRRGGSGRGVGLLREEVGGVAGFC